MELNERERKIGIGAAIVLGLGAFWYIADSVYFSPRHALGQEDTKLQEQIDSGNDTLAKRDRLNKVWKVMQANGLQLDASAAESHVLQALSDWARVSGLQISIRREHDSTEGKFQLISFRATASGGLRAIVRMMWHIESADIPMRVNDVEITPRHGDDDDLAIQFGVSTLCQLAETDKTKSAVSAVSARE